MKKLMICTAAAATVFCAAAASFAPEAEAGMRIGFGFRPFFRPHFHAPPPRHYRDDDDDYRARRYRRRHTKRRSKPSAPKIVKKAVPLIRFADEEGRQYDPSTKVWFDGESQCFSGGQAFTFKSDTWRYGKSSWVENNGAWEVSSGDAPDLVSCDSVPKFAAKAKAFAAKTEKTETTTKKAESDKGASEQPTKGKKAPAATIKTAETDPTAAAAKPAVATPVECKKYFPSIGRMLTVPCGE